ncbi:MAG: hypothetical protein NXI27_27000 [Alphaproteobacteria bacterium]|nr:hypothetical protein [Alphaproteobacteria bacterium]
MKHLSILLIPPIIAATMVAGPVDAQAQQLTNSMTCERAKATYERQGRVTTRTRSGSVLPIYGGVPASEGRTLYCGQERVRNTVRVITSDNKRCVIAYRCS